MIRLYRVLNSDFAPVPVPFFRTNDGPFFRTQLDAVAHIKKLQETQHQMFHVAALDIITSVPPPRTD